MANGEEGGGRVVRLPMRVSRTTRQALAAQPGFNAKSPMTSGEVMGLRCPLGEGLRAAAAGVDQVALAAGGANGPRPHRGARSVSRCARVPLLLRRQEGRGVGSGASPNFARQESRRARPGLSSPPCHRWQERGFAETAGAVPDARCRTAPRRHVLQAPLRLQPVNNLRAGKGEVTHAAAAAGTGDDGGRKLRLRR